MGRIHLYAFSVDEKAEIFDFRHEKFAFLWVCIQLGTVQAFNDEFEVLEVFFFSPGEDEDIIKIDYTEHVNKTMKCSINVGLKGGWGIHQTEGHDQVFKMAVSHMEGSLPLISFLNSDLVIGIS